MKKHTFRRLSVLLLSLVLLGAASVLPASAATPKYTEKDIPVSLQFICDTENYYPDYPNQGSLTLINGTEDILEGSVELQFGYSYNTLEVVSAMTLPLELTPGITKTTDFICDIPSGIDSCRVLLYGKNGKLLRSQDISLRQTLYSGYMGYIGWMTDSSVKASAVFNRDITSFWGDSLTPDTFPTDFELMKRYCCIIVNNVDLSASSPFSQKQIDLLKKYIAEGGTVIVGTGKNTDILSAFSEYFAGSVGTAVKVHTASFTDSSSYYSVNSFLTEYSLNQPAWLNSQSYYGKTENSPYEISGTVSKDRISIQFPSVSVCEISDANFTVSGNAANRNIQLYKSGTSNLYLCNINLETDALLNSSHSDGFLFGLFYDAEVSLLNPFRFPLVPVPDQNQLEGLGPSGLRPLVPILLLILYAAGGILVPFLVAKIKKKPKIAIIGIPSASVLFAVAVILFGMMRHGFGPYAYSANVAVLEKNGEATVYCAAKTAGPGGGKTKISFGREDTRYFAKQYVGYLNSNYYNQNGLRISQEGTGFVEFPSVSSWEESYAGGYYRDTYAGAFEVQIITSEDKKSFSVSVRNNTGKDLESAVVTVFGNTLYVGEFAAGAVYTNDSLKIGQDVFQTEDVLLKAFYEPNGLSIEDLNNDFYSGATNYGYVPLSASSSLSYYAPYYNTKISADGLQSLAKKSEDAALDAVALINAMQFGSDTGSSLTVYGIDRNAASALEYNGKTVRKNHHTTVVMQRIPISESVLNSLERPSVNSEFTLSVFSPCNFSTWDRGFVKLEPDESAVFMTPFQNFMHNGEYFQIQLESDESLMSCEAYVCMLRRNCDMEIKPVQCKIDKDNLLTVNIRDLVDSLNNAYIFGKGYGYENHLYLPYTSITIPQEEVPVDKLVVILCARYGEVTVRGIALKDPGYEAPEPFLPTEESAAPLPVPMIPEKN